LLRQLTKLVSCITDKQSIGVGTGVGRGGGLGPPLSSKLGPGHSLVHSPSCCIANNETDNFVLRYWYLHY